MIRFKFLRRGSALVGCIAAFAAFLASAEPAIRDLPFDQEYHEAYPLATGPENDVRAIDVDGEGRVWAATAAGVRLLGENGWSAPAGAAAAGPAYEIHADRSGRAWGGGWDGVYRLKADGVTQAGAQGAVIVTIAESPSPTGAPGTLFAGGPDGIFKLEGELWSRIEGEWPDTVRAIAPISDDELWIATMTGLYRHSPKEANRLHWFLPSRVLSSAQLSLEWAPDGSLWLGSTGGIDIFLGGSRLGSMTGAVGAMPNRIVRAMAFDNAGQAWVATRLGVARSEGGAWSLRHSRRWLLSDDARDVALGPDGTAWVATGAGVSAIRSRRMTLAEKAAHYQAIARARHVRAPGFVQKAALRNVGDLSDTWIPDTDNDGLFTGNYVAAESFRYAVTGAEDARANAREAFGSLEFLQHITSTDHFVARAAVPVEVEPVGDRNRTYDGPQYAERRIDDARWKKVEERWRLSADGKWWWKGDTSSDETTGHMFAYATYHDLAADDEEKKRAATLMDSLMGGIVRNGFVLNDIDGTATRWGVWAPEQLNDDADWRPERGINSVEILSYLNAAARLTGKPGYRAAADRLVSEHHYDLNTLQGKTVAPSELTHIDDQLISLSFPSLLNYETDPQRRTIYQASMRQWHALIAEDHSPLYDFVFNRFSGKSVPLDGAVFVLRDWPLDMIDWTVDNTGREDIEFDRTPGAEGRNTSRRLPPSEHGLVRWDDHPRRAIRGAGGRSEEAGTAWLLPYWMGRYYGLIGPPEPEEGR